MTLTVSDPSAEAFDRLVAEHDAVIVDFSASWCMPCHAYTPKFLRAAREMRRRHEGKRFVFVTLDVDVVPEVARRFGVRSVPTTVVVRERRSWFKKKKGEVERWSGDRSWNDLVRALDDALAHA